MSEGNLVVRRKGFKSFEDDLDDTAGVSWWLLEPTCLSDDEIVAALSVEGYYGGPGRSFAHNPFVSRSRSRVLVTQSGGYDI